ncbi:MAG: SPOR domain-containing protein [Bacteroidota bacterium]
MKKQLFGLLAAFFTLSSLCPSEIYAQKKPSRMGIDFRVGLPMILTSAEPKPAAYGGAGLRYNINNVLVTQLDMDAGALTGIGNQSVFIPYFRTTFIQGGLKLGINLSAMASGRGNKNRFNMFLNGGANYTMFLYDETRSLNGNTYERYLIPNWGLESRYYANEFVDFLAGFTANYSPTTGIDNTWNNKRGDQFLFFYTGIGIKLLNAKRTQQPTWKHIEIAYGPKPDEEFTSLAKDVKDNSKRSTDSIATVLRKEIKGVDEKVNTVNIKVDSMDVKLNMILNLLGGGSANNNNTNSKDTTKTGKPIAGQPGKIVPVNPPTKPVTNSAEAKQEVKKVMVTPQKVKEAYAIVVGSFVQDVNALNSRDKYLAKGWDAHILGSPESQYRRIVIFSNNYYEAVKIVTELRKTEQPDVWMLDINTGKGVYIK